MIEKRRMKEYKMGNIIIGLILVVIVYFAVRSSGKHFRGEGGCCGGGCVPKAKRKRLEGTEVARKRIDIEGMHCKNCKNQVESSLNQIEGVVTKVNLRKNCAIVSMSREIEEEELKKAVEMLDFRVIAIKEL